MLDTLDQVHIELPVLDFALISGLKQSQVRGHWRSLVLVESVGCLIDPLLNVLARLIFGYEARVHPLLVFAEVLLFDLVSDLLMAQFMDILVIARLFQDLRRLHLYKGFRLMNRLDCSFLVHLTLESIKSSFLNRLHCLILF